MASGTIKNIIKDFSFDAAKGLGRAAKWGMVGGAAMGTIEKVRGGSFFEGASRGAMLGGTAGFVTGGMSSALKTTLKNKINLKNAKKVTNRVP